MTALSPDPTIHALAHEIILLAESLGWLVVPTLERMLILTNGRTLLFGFLAGPEAPITKAQALWYTELLHAGKGECHIWRPQDLTTLPLMLDRRST